ncbi:putative uridine/cytidine kinase [Helianthus annuus]|nr:putative uridine/cytidine kinase [Helianthus annuus]
MMAQDNSNVESNSRKQRLLKDQVRLVKRKDNARFEIVQIKDSLSFEKGFFVVIRACQMLAQKNDGIILIGLAGPSGAGKTAFTDKILSFMPSVAVISMDNYNDATRVIDGNFDDPRLTDYDTLLKNILDLKEGKTIEVPIYDFKSSCRTGYRFVGGPYWDVPAGRKDSKTASFSQVESNIPRPNDGLLSIISKFLYQSLSVTDMVALSGTKINIL